MGLPRVLKNLNAHIQGGSYLGRIAEFTQPKLAIATEEFRGGGMPGPVDLDLGLEKMEAEITIAGHEVELVRLFGTTDAGGVRVRLVEAMQVDDNSLAQAVEIYFAGRFKELDFGGSKLKTMTEHKYKASLVYYRRVVDGRVEVEIDMLAGVYVVDGVDRYAEIMAIIS